MTGLTIGELAREDQDPERVCPRRLENRTVEVYPGEEAKVNPESCTMRKSPEEMVSKQIFFFLDALKVAGRFR